MMKYDGIIFLHQIVDLASLHMHNMTRNRKGTREAQNAQLTLKACLKCPPCARIIQARSHITLRSRVGLKIVRGKRQIGRFSVIKSRKLTTL